MRQRLALRALGQILGWDDERTRREYAWLEIMSRLKYDTYRGFVAGVRFIESLADWLQQFEVSEREAAYGFVRNCLVYIGPAEMQHLVELAYPATIRPRLFAAAASAAGLPLHRIWTQPDAEQRYRALLRRTLFFGLSDGARIDAFRRATVGLITNEQVVVGPQINDDKWASLLDHLRKDTSDQDAAFSFVYLIDDFAGSGKTLLRRGKTGELDGKMVRFWDQISRLQEGYFSDDWTLCVHYYIATYFASEEVQKRQHCAAKLRGEDWFRNVEFSFGTVLPQSLPDDTRRFPGLASLVDTYYDPAIKTKSIEVGGTDGRWGFGDCALPLVLEHNTPNNSVALLWADTDGEGGHHAMRPLFRRRERHL